MANQSDPRTNPQQTREDQTKGSQSSNMGNKGSQTSNQGTSGSTSSGSTSHTMGEKDRNKSGNQPSKEAQVKGGQHSQSGGKS